MMNLSNDLQMILSALADDGFTVRDELASHGSALILMLFLNAPVKLHKDELSIQIRLASSRRFFSLYSPLALIHDALDPKTYDYLLRRQFSADQVGSATFAITQFNDADVLMAVQHWPFNTISSTQFDELLEVFIQASFTLMKLVSEIAPNTPSLQPMNG